MTETTISPALLQDPTFNTKENPAIQHLGRGIELHSWKGVNGSIYFRRYNTETEEYGETTEIQTSVLPNTPIYRGRNNKGKKKKR